MVRPYSVGVGLLAAGLLLLPFLPLSGQERPRCTLSWEPATDDTRSVSVRDPAGGHVTYVGGGMVWTCGTAVMEADSAIHFEAQRRVELLGRVRYRDTIRTLQSERLDYYQVGDRVVAQRDVLLTRIASGSTLEGPRVEFLRAVSGVAERTLATGRPHMVLRSETDPEAPPLEVDANRSEFAGEERAAAWGDVVIRRPDLRATADSAFFDLEAGEGVLHGDPVAEGDRFELSGDTLRLHFTDGEVEEVWALGTGRAAGEAFEVLSEIVRIQVEANEVDAVWAYGGERSLALSDRHRLYGDSLRFYLIEGALDTIVAVGNAAAVDQPPDEDGGPGEGAQDPADDAPTVVPSEENLSQEEPDDRPASEAESAALSSGAAERAGRPNRGGDRMRHEDRRIPPPELGTERETNWVTGDTLWAIFEPVPAEEELPDEEEAPGGAEIDEVADLADEAQTGEAGDVDSVESSSESEARRRESRLERLRVVGNARAFYAAVRDTLVTRTPSRNYLVGREIQILFEDGEARRVMGREAIGVYLDPLEEDEGSPRPIPPPEPDTEREPPANADPVRDGDEKDAEPGEEEDAEAADEGETPEDERGDPDVEAA